MHAQLSAVRTAGAGLRGRAHRGHPRSQSAAATASTRSRLSAEILAQSYRAVMPCQANGGAQGACACAHTLASHTCVAHSLPNSAASAGAHRAAVATSSRPSRVSTPAVLACSSRAHTSSTLAAGGGAGVLRAPNGMPAQATPQVRAGTPPRRRHLIYTTPRCLDEMPILPRESTKKKIGFAPNAPCKPAAGCELVV